METEREVVITGMGVVSPIGIGNDQFWTSLAEGRSGVRKISDAENNDLPCPIGGEVVDFKPGNFIKPRKNLKVMCRSIQLGCAAAALASTDAGLDDNRPDPDRIGVVYGADMMPCDVYELAEAFRCCIDNGQFEFAHWGRKGLREMYPLWMLKYLPNMPACHIAIALDARGPNNSAILSGASSLSAVTEARRVILRGQADVMIAGGTGSQITPTVYARHHVWHLSERYDDPAAACRPFDAHRDGMVQGEGSAAFVLESRSHAEARGAKILARVSGAAGSFEPHSKGQPLEGDAIGRAIQFALRDARLKPSDLGHVNANAMGALEDDKIEARAIQRTLGDVPVTAPKSYFGNLFGGSGAVEMAVSLAALGHGIIPPTLNYTSPDPECPVNVVHGRPIEGANPSALLLNHNQTGQAVAVVIEAE